MLGKAKKLIEETIFPTDKVLVGISGGADSVALAHLLYSMGIQLLPVHINFHLRGAESQRDQKFVEDFCNQYLPKTTLITLPAQTEVIAKQSGISIEMAARDIRYKAFRTIATQEDCQWIAVAHHADDQVETALLNLSRGTGGAGMAGMKIKNGKIFRPFLTTPKKEILQYLELNHLKYVFDSTNDDTEIKRNFVRHKLIPSFEELNPAFFSIMLDNMSNFEEEQIVLNQLKEEFIRSYVHHDESSIELQDIVEHSSNRYFFKRWICDLGFNYAQAEDMLASWRSDKSISFSSGNVLAQIYRGKLFVIEDVSQYQGFSPTPLSATNHLNSLTIYQGERKGIKRLFLHPDFEDKELLIRMGNNEDIFQPFGMKHGRKSLFRFLGEQGVPEFFRPYCPVVDCGGEIVAALPFEISESARAEDLNNAFCISIHFESTPLGTILGNLVGVV